MVGKRGHSFGREAPFHVELRTADMNPPNGHGYQDGGWAVFDARTDDDVPGGTCLKEGEATELALKLNGLKPQHPDACDELE